MWNMIYLVTGLFFTLLLVWEFFSKEVIPSRENRIFKLILVANLTEYLLEIPLQIFVRTINIDNLVADIFCRCYLVSITLSYAIFTMYVFVICFNKSQKNYERKIKNSKIGLIIAESIITILLFLAPYSKYFDGTKMFVTGSAVDILKLFIALQIILYILLLISNYKRIRDKKYLPIFFVIVCLIFMTVLNTIDPSILISSMITTFICYTMFFTIENPDLRMLRQMEASKNQAERANRAKSDFLSSMSHEIRTPLNAIVGFSEDIQNYEKKLPAQIVEDAGYIMEASKTLLEIVGNILDINKIESNKMELTEVNYNIKEELTALANINAIRIGEKPIDFKVNLAEDIPFELYGDKTHLKQIVNNLLSNAIKYTDKGKIEFSVKCINLNDKCNLIISVKDTGRGIKPEDVNKLFTKFERLGIERNSTTEGTGLGLAITKALVEMMGGKINVQSEYGKGSLFIVHVPQKISKMIQDEEDVRNKEKLLDKANKKSSTKRFDGKRILIVDDNKLNIKVAMRALSDYNLVIDECYDGEECLKKIKNGNEYDLILMDIMMPNMSGETALSKLKENPKFSIPVIALTADAVSGSKEKYESEGFATYIAKPFSKDEITKKLDEVFKNNK